MEGLATEFVGLHLRSPIIVGSAAITQDLDAMRRAEDHGAGAVIMKGLADVEAMRQSPSPRYALLERGRPGPPSRTFYSYEQASRWGPEEYADELRRAREALSIPVIANVDCLDLQNWIAYIGILDQAGVAAFEVNVSCPHGSVAFAGGDVEAAILDVVRELRAATTTPLIVKLTPQLTSPPTVVARLEELGVQGVTLFNRFTGLEVDVEAAEPTLHGGYAGHGGAWAKHFVLRWVSAIAPHTGLDVSASGGVTEAADAIAYLLAGAQTVQVCTAVYLQGYEVVERLNRGLQEYLERHSESLEAIRGRLAGRIKGLHEVDRRHTRIAQIEARGTPPCKARCPLGEDVQGYLSLLADGRPELALRLILRNHPFPASLGRCCHHPCEAECVRTGVDDPLQIAALKRYAADHGTDWGPQLPWPSGPCAGGPIGRDSGRPVGRGFHPAPEVAGCGPARVAIAGGGPAGLTCAYRLALAGHRCTVFEKLPVAGGMLAVGVPEYRLPPGVTASEVDRVRSVGVEIRTGVEVGKDVTVAQLRAEGYDAVFLATGAHIGRRLGMPGEDLPGVTDGVWFLRQRALGHPVAVGREALVVGGGDVAVDAARTAVRLGAQVTVVYRRTAAEMPARRAEVEEMLAEGVRLSERRQPVSISLAGDGRLQLTCAETQPEGADADGRRRFVPTGETTALGADTIIAAIGQQADLSVLAGLGEIRRGDWVAADPGTGATAVTGVFAGGDVVTGPGALVDAVAAGKRAAAAIGRFLRGEPAAAPDEALLPTVRAEDVIPALPILTRRQVMPQLAPDERRTTFAEVHLGLPEHLARAEAERCLDCGLCSRCGDCERLCPYRAIRRWGDLMTVLPECDGCGFCALMCRQEAIRMEPRPV